MLSMVITVLLACLFLGGLTFLALRTIRRFRQSSPVQLAAQQPTAAIPIREQTVAGQYLAASLSPVSPRSSHWRSFVSIAFLMMVAVTLFVQSGLADGAFRSISRVMNVPAQYSGFDVNTAQQPLPGSASSRIVRVDSALRNQYYTDYQWQVWSYSSCSGISLEEVMNAYGRHLIAADVLQEELKLGVWNVAQGLTGGEKGMIETANYFGFKANLNPPRTLQDLIRVTNSGYPVIVGEPTHILVVRGGDAQYVYLVDSSPANVKMMTHQQVMSIWTGVSVLITPA